MFAMGGTVRRFPIRRRRPPQLTREAAGSCSASMNPRAADELREPPTIGGVGKARPNTGQAPKPLHDHRGVLSSRPIATVSPRRKDASARAARHRGVCAALFMRPNMSVRNGPDRSCWACARCRQCRPSMRCNGYHSLVPRGTPKVEHARRQSQLGRSLVHATDYESPLCLAGKNASCTSVQPRQHLHITRPVSIARRASARFLLQVRNFRLYTSVNDFAGRTGCSDRARLARCDSPLRYGGGASDRGPPYRCCSSLGGGLLVDASTRKTTYRPNSLGCARTRAVGAHGTDTLEVGMVYGWG